MVSRPRGFRNRPSSRTRSGSRGGPDAEEFSGFRGREAHRDFREREERPHDIEERSLKDQGELLVPEHMSARERIRWENEHYDRMKGRSRSRGSNYVKDRERRSRSHHRSRSADRNEIRFEPPDSRFEEPEFIQRRRRSISKEWNIPRKGRWDEDSRHVNRFSPPEPSRFSQEHFPDRALGQFDSGPSFNANMPMEVWDNNHSQPVELVGVTTNQGFSQNQNFGQAMAMTHPFQEIQGAPTASSVTQGFPQGMPVVNQGFAVAPGMFIENTTPEAAQPGEVNSDSNEAPVVPEFNPETSKLSGFDWLKLIEDIAKQRNWKKDEKLYIMTSRLGGFARQWYLTTGVQCRNWSELKGAFLTAFPTEMGFHTLLQKMLARTKEENETMCTYFHHKVALLNACEIHGRKAVSCIIGGLQNSKLRQLAKAENCSDPDALYLYLRSCNNEALTNPPTKKTKPGTADEPKNKPNKELHAKAGKVQECYFCKKVGHIKAQCPSKLHKCTACFEYGHECGIHEKELSNHNQVMHGSLSRKPTYPKYFTDVSINGAILRGYVDQGSESITIREEDARNLKLPIKKQYRVIRGFCGSSISSMGVVDMPLCVDRAIANIRMFVVPDHVQAIPVIVGQAFTEQPHVVVVKNGDRIRFYQRMDNGETNFDF